MIGFINWRLKNLFYAIILLFISLVGGAIGYMWIEEYSFLEAIYMCVLTISSVGFGEVKPLSDNGRIFTIFYIIFNISIFAFIISIFTKYIFEGELQLIFRQYMKEQEIGKFNNHVIVCGYGRNGSKASEVLAFNNTPFVVIEKEPETIRQIEERKNIAWIEGDSTNDEILKLAGVTRAKAIIATLPSDADNVFIILTAKELNPNLVAISRASEEASESKMKRAGADHIIMPDRIGGLHMANMVLKPGVMDFLDLINGVGEVKLTLEEVKAGNLEPQYKNKTIRELDIRNKSGASVIGFKKADNSPFLINPHPDITISDNDKLIILGTEKEIQNFIRIFIGNSLKK